MPALSFQKRFVPFIESGDKTHTIRAYRKRPFRAGDTLSLYYGMRTKVCRLLLRCECTATRDLLIDRAGDIYIDGCALSMDEMEALALRDGFRSHTDMMTFWEGRLPFRGQIIHWRMER